MRAGTARVTPDFALTDAEIHALDEQGWFLRDALLGRLAAMDVHDAVESLAAAGRLRPAGLSRGATASCRRRRPGGRHRVGRAGRGVSGA
jgi:hypothetical protein